MRVWLSKCSTVSVVLPVSLSLLLSCSLALAFRFSAVKDSVNLFCCWLVFFFFFFPSFASSLGLCCFSFPFPLARLEKLLKKKKEEKREVRKIK